MSGTDTLLHIPHEWRFGCIPSSLHGWLIDGAGKNFLQVDGSWVVHGVHICMDFALALLKYEF
jgi:hypothetical protein